MEIVPFYACGLKPFICEVVLEELQYMTPNVSSDLLGIRCFEAAKKCSHRLLMGHSQPRQSMNTKSSKMRLPTIMIGDTLDAPSVGFTLCNKQDMYPHLYLLDTEKVVFKLEEILLLESIPTADNLQNSLQQKDLSVRPLLRDHDQVPAVSEA